MKLVETDIPHGDEEVAEIPRPPRPERRRVYVSLILTGGVLVATVAAVYLAFPKRDNELLTVALEANGSVEPLELEKPSGAELTAWTVGAVGEPVPWPATGGTISVLGTRRARLLKRPVAVILYQVGEQRVTMLALRAFDAPPRKYRREDGDELAVSWRDGPWTFVAVGPASRSESWRIQLGVP